MSRFEIEVRPEVPLPLAADRVREHLIRAAAVTLREEDVTGPAALTLMLISEQQIQVLNRTYRRLDKPTDVLSFLAAQDVPGMGAYLGDVAIAVPVAQAQADAAGHDLLAELILLTVHGVLHLLGHDHYEPHEKSRMWAVQDRVLSELGLDLSSPIYDD